MKAFLPVLAVMLCLVMILPSAVFANEPCSLTLSYTKENVIFSDLEINIYRIADQNYDKLSPYDSYPAEVKGITSQTEWSGVAVTLRGYIAADGIESYASATTDNEGKVTFDAIEEGLYLVTGVRAEKEGRVFNFYDFMILVTEDVTAAPKASVSEPADGEKTYSILKLWKNDDQETRPASVTVDILKDGELYETVILDYINNWSYSFKSDADCVWSVAERNVPEGYFVTVTEKDTSFIITNTAYDEKDDDGTPGEDTTADSGSDTKRPDGTTVGPDADAPQTGDFFPMKRCMFLFCVSGILLIISGIGMRKNDHEKDR